MLTIDNFQSDVRGNWAYLSKLPGNLKKPKESGTAAFEIYRNTCNSDSEFIVIGPGELRKDEKLVRKYGLITLDQNDKGAILGERQWSMLINDSFLLGAVEKGKRVYLKINSKEFRAEQLGCLKTKKLTTLGRELAILQNAGYERRAQNEDFIVFEQSRKIQFPAITYLWNSLRKVDLDQLAKFSGCC